MSVSTQDAIVEATLYLVERKPLSKITIRDIVEACGITRNTFYYYFHDVYEVLERVLTLELQRLNETSEVSCTHLITAAFRFCITYKKVLVNLYRTLGYEQLARYLNKQLHTPLFDCICRTAQDVRVAREDLQLICTLYEEAIVGTMMRWITDSKKEFDEERLMTAIERLKVLFHGELTRVLQQGEANPLAGGKNE